MRLADVKDTTEWTAAKDKVTKALASATTTETTDCKTAGAACDTAKTAKAK